MKPKPLSASRAPSACSWASATTPAVDVRSTRVGDQDRHGRRPRRRSATSSSLRPPSGPTMNMISPVDGHAPARPAAASAASCRTTVSAVCDPQRRSSAVVIGSRHCGYPEPPALLRRLPGGRPPAGQAALDPLRRPSHHRPLRLPGHDLVDAQLGQHLDGQFGTVALGQRLDDHVAARGTQRSRSTSATSIVTPALSIAITGPRTAVPAPSLIRTISPTRIRRTAAAWRPSSPPRATCCADLRVRPGRRGTGARSRERLLQPAQNTLVPAWPPRPRAASRRGPSANWRSSSRCSSSSLVGVCTSSVTPSSPRPSPRSRGTPRPGMAIRVPGLGAGRDVDRDLAGVGVQVVPLRLEGVERDLGAQRRRGHRHLDHHLEVVAVALEHVVRGRRSARRTGRPPGHRRGRPRPGTSRWIRLPDATPAGIFTLMVR